MPTMGTKVHAIARADGETITTYCSIVGWPDRGDRYDTAAGNIFRAVAPGGAVNCKNCLSTIESRTAAIGRPAVELDVFTPAGARAVTLQVR